MIPAADLFCGLGGFTLGAEATGRVDVLLAANHWREAIDWHAINHPRTQHVCQDIAQMDMRILPDLRAGILLASPACQGHSEASQPARAGTGGSSPPDAWTVRLKHQGDRNTALGVVAAVDTAEPAAFIVENVAPFLRWRLYPQWVGMLRSLGYHVTESILDAAAFGSPQDRKRAIIIGCRTRAVTIEPARDRARTIAECLDREADHWTPIAAKSERMRSRIAKAQREAGARCLWNNVSESTGRPLDGRFPTITTRAIGQLYLCDGDRCRTLTARELARAQSFPDHTALPRERALAGKLVGNAIDVRLATALVDQVADVLDVREAA